MTRAIMCFTIVWRRTLIAGTKSFTQAGPPRLQELPELLFAPSDMLQDLLEQAPAQITGVHRDRRDNLARD